jgi:hypothetical protein
MKKKTKITIIAFQSQYSCKVVHTSDEISCLKKMLHCYIDASTCATDKSP